MKKYRQRYQDLSQKAAQLKQTLQAAPSVATELRQVITQTVDELKQMKDDFRIGESAFPEVLAQITGAEQVLEETGYALDRVEMEMGVNTRLIIHLNRHGETSERTLRALQQKHQDNIALRSLLTALIKAEELAASVGIPDMTYRELAVEIGMIPCVRLSWWASTAEAVEETMETHPPPLPAAPGTSTTPPVSSPPTAAKPAEQAASYFRQSSFFERRSEPASTPVAAQTAPVPSTVPEASHFQPPSRPAKPVAPGPAGTASTKDPLARFKKMPDLTKRH
jgi:hypothetical protein